MTSYTNRYVLLETAKNEDVGNVLCRQERPTRNDEDEDVGNVLSQQERPTRNEEDEDVGNVLSQQERPTRNGEERRRRKRPVSTGTSYTKRRRIVARTRRETAEKIPKFPQVGGQPKIPKLLEVPVDDRKLPNYQKSPFFSLLHSISRQTVTTLFRDEGPERETRAL